MNIKFTTGPAIPRPTETDEVDFTIVIAHRGHALGLWATIHSCEIELADSGYKYNYILVPNGEEKWHIDEIRVWHFLEKSGKLRDLIKSHAPLAPPSARNIGAAMANGKYIFFLDNHCLVAKNYFKRAIESMEKYNIDLLHSMTRFYTGEMDHWHYELSLESNFWGNCINTKPMNGDEPYRCAVAGHGGYAVTRKAWKEVGGYWDGFAGYGGEECYLDLKMWQMGKSVWLDPKMIHYHFAGERSYNRHYSDDYYMNMMMCANLIGGQKWLDTVTKGLHKYPRTRSDKTLFDLADESCQRSIRHAVQLQQVRHKELDELLVWFKTENIPH
jgi:glycosyltransferase involved in cell wall biosynthesis